MYLEASLFWMTDISLTLCQVCRAVHRSDQCWITSDPWTSPRQYHVEAGLLGSISLGFFPQPVNTADKQSINDDRQEGRVEETNIVRLPEDRDYDLVWKICDLTMANSAL
ncbi:uncharacterized protein EAE98_009986 [Botrytis deweyae]|uniref:Uncharacterized protein n=1 Tax=Botrytis deweyae TaxID=2478750 RepID=A0ABQ7IA19_9HELO|nr:uncharacterized protein EAE98_009986 [Botrytis deweyae]KAF7917958.1 hypothetical protein EAE98_009986 [Botrytis deweyae]